MNNPEQPNNQNNDESTHEEYLKETFKCGLCQNGAGPCPVHTDVVANLERVKNFKFTEDIVEDVGNPEFDSIAAQAPDFTDEDRESSDRLADQAAEEARQEQAWADYQKSEATPEDSKKMYEELFGKDLE